MVVPAESQSPPKPTPAPRKGGAEPQVWLVPGETGWEVRGPGDQVRLLVEGETTPPARVNVVGLPETLVTCQLFWLETTDEKTVPDLVRMQCERRSLLRQDEVWTHRILRKSGERSLVQVLILQNTLPPHLQVEGTARFEAHARCLALPPRALCVWRSLGTVSLALTGANGVVYFQSLPHQTLARECLRDIQSTLWLASAQDWVGSVDALVLVGDWSGASGPELEASAGLPVQRVNPAALALPSPAMELTPQPVRHLRQVRRRQHRIQVIIGVLALLYAVFFLFQVASNFLIAARTRDLQSRLNALMPRVLDMQTTARQLDALNPALDTRTYPLEILRRAMALLPEQGVRLTGFEITAGKIQISGESSTAREAFDYMRSLETAKDLDHIKWDEAPQPVPLPNDTTRFSITGDVEGAYHDPEQS